MEEDLRSFCNTSVFWNSTVFLENSWPRVPACFQITVLTWIPCAWLWLTLPPYCYYLYHSDNRHRNIPANALSATKSGISFLLGIIVLVGLIHDVTKDENLSLSHVPPAILLSVFLRLATFMLAGFLSQIERLCGIVSSGIQFVFWLILLSLSVVPFYSNIMQKKYNWDLFKFIIFYIYFLAVVVQFILHCIAEKPETSAEKTPEEKSNVNPLYCFKQKPCPEKESSVLNRLYFWWLNPLVLSSVKTPLKLEDMWQLNQEDKNSYLTQKFEKHWRREIIYSKIKLQKMMSSVRRKQDLYTRASGMTEKTPLLSGKTGSVFTTKEEKTSPPPEPPSAIPSLSSALTRTFGFVYLVSLGFKFLSDVLQFVSPILLGILIDYADKRDQLPAWRGYIPAVLLFLASCLQSIFYHQNYHVGMSVGMRIRSTLIAAIFRKALTLSPSARRGNTLGEIVNLMSVDCQRIQDTFTYSWSLMTCPLQMALGIYLLWNVVGASCIAGLVVLILMVPLNSFVVVKQRALNVKVLRLKGHRTKLMTDVLNGMKVLKMYAWEPSFEEKVKSIRDEELVYLRKIAWLQGSTTFCWILAPYLVTLATFATYILISPEHVLDAKKAFVALALFNILRLPINLMSQTISLLVQAVVSIKRIQDFLVMTDLDSTNVHHSSLSDYAIEVENASFAWDLEAPSPTLKDINLKIPEGMLIAVVGQVGSGKSSLISALLGEMNKLEGSVNFRGTTAYVPQEAWIQNATLMNNILFGKPYIQKKYQKVIEACALVPDLDMLPGRDHTEIGEKGINISGGQKQRVSLARAVYSNSNVYLLDDPLSAVDSHVGKHIFDRVIGPKGLLKNKTRVLVTHGVHWLPMVDMVVVMVNGKITETGNYEQLIKHDGPFAQFLKEYFLNEPDNEIENEHPEIHKIKTQILEKVESVTSDAWTSDMDGKRLSLSVRRESKKQELGKSSYPKPAEKSIISRQTLTSAETSQEGQVKLSVFSEYAKGVGVLTCVIVFIVFTLYHSTSVFSNYWLTYWTEDSLLLDRDEMNTTEYYERKTYYLSVYGILGAIQGILVFLYAIILSLGMVTASGRLHHRMLKKILRAPMSFFDTTPLGRITNRFSADIDIMDNTLPLTFRITLNSLFLALSTLIVCTINTPYFAAFIVPVAILYYFIMKFYIPTASQLKRVESVTRSPVFNHFSETVTGASVIRAYKVQDRFKEESSRRVDQNMEPYYINFSSSRWLGVRLEFLGNCLVLGATMFSIFSDLNGALVGLSITYALQATGILNLLVVNLTDLANNIVCVERIKEYYTDVKSEAEWTSENKPPAEWPQSGHIKFLHYRTRYREGLDLVLKGVTVTINHGEKVGIVGRTGAGKSSLTLSLFRLIESAGGEIIIDGVRIADIGLHDLRSKITILPQDPVIFSGSLRLNLDPFNEYTDLQIWKALETAHLKSFVQSLTGQLQYDCGEGGMNLSVGQRQLLCLARTLLKKTNILILDEATAAVDFQTDELIQQTIQREFRNCTVLSIAHRLNTIMDYDRIMVLDNGQVVEFDSPENLLAKKDSIFYSMAKNAGLATDVTVRGHRHTPSPTKVETRDKPSSRPGSAASQEGSGPRASPVPPPPTTPISRVDSEETLPRSSSSEFETNDHSPGQRRDSTTENKGESEV
ncbi:multidrug resistance-associated protein 1-like isoform X1 [Saccostrea cucullata]|uniref:multidrug resistance-associated protein 1-like isoform X1 n=2 Tax=Saccostrea cuccullata TaxID=36930 RepID=UPI002ED02DC4